MTETDTSTPEHIELARLAVMALGNYPLGPTRLSFLGHGDYAGFVVHSAGGGQWTLRLHVPGRARLAEGPADDGAVRSELTFLQGLADAEDVTAPRPVATRDGKLLADIAAESYDGVRCSLLTRVEGECIPGGAQPGAQHAAAIGRLLGRLHAHSRTWLPPGDFTRPGFDADRLAERIEAVDAIAAAGIAPADAVADTCRAAERAAALLADIPAGPDHQGVIHGDLDAQAVLFADGEARAVEFCRCGLGPYVYDVAAALRHLPPELRGGALGACSAAGSDLGRVGTDVLEAMLLAAEVWSFADLAAEPAAGDYIARALPYVAEHHARPLMAGRQFLLLR